MAKCLLLAGVRRTYEPGTKHDLLPILIGPQGGGKSTFCRLLLPTGRQGGIRAWFFDSVDLAESTQKQVEAIGPALIVEYSEVAGLEAAKRERLKAYLSRQDDRYRPPYFTYAVTIPRRWIGVGTANDTGQGILPSDSTGYRRYVAISVSRPGPASVRHYMETNRDQLWAEAIVAYKTNESHWPPEHLEKEREETNLTFARVNEVLEDKLSALTERHAGGSPVSLADLMIEAGLVRGSVEASQDVPMQRSIARHLRKSGWGRRKTASQAGGTRVHMWEPPARCVCSICLEPKQPLMDPGGGKGLVCTDCAGSTGGAAPPPDAPQQFPLGAHLETRLLDIEKAHADSAVGGFPPSALVQQIEGLRALIAAIQANPSIADFPEEQLAVYRGAKRLSETIAYAIQDVDPGRWQQVKTALTGPDSSCRFGGEPSGSSSKRRPRAGRLKNGNGSWSSFSRNLTFSRKNNCPASSRVTSWLETIHNLAPIALAKELRAMVALVAQVLSLT